MTGPTGLELSLPAAWRSIDLATPGLAECLPEWRWPVASDRADPAAANLPPTPRIENTPRAGEGVRWLLVRPPDCVLEVALVGAVATLPPLGLDSAQMMRSLAGPDRGTATGELDGVALVSVVGPGGRSGAGGPSGAGALAGSVRASMELAYWLLCPDATVVIVFQAFPVAPVHARLRGDVPIERAIVGELSGVLGAVRWIRGSDVDRSAPVGS